MPDEGRFPEREIEQSLEDLGARIDYPPTPDAARAARRKLDEDERSQQARRTVRWPPFLAPRWTAVAAALVLISVLAFSPTLHTALSGLFVTHSGSGAGSASKSEGGGSEDHYKQGATPQEAGAPTAGEGEAVTTCPSPSIEAVPARAAAGANFRLHGRDFSSGCNGAARDVGIFLRQGGKTWKLTTLDAGRDLAFTSRLRVPKGAAQGRATVLATAGPGERAKERFVVLQ